MQTNFAAHHDLTNPAVHTTPHASSRVWMSWAGIAVSCLGALVILSTAAGLPVFDHAWSAGLVVLSPLLGFVWLFDLVGVGLTYEGWRSLAIELTAGIALCSIGVALLAAHHRTSVRVTVSFPAVSS